MIHCFYCRLVSTYEDKVLGLSENGEKWWKKSKQNWTFPKFIRRVTSEWTRRKTANEHWRPYYVHCDYCDIKYDFIGRVENFKDDLAYISQRTNIDMSKVPPEAFHVHPSGSDKRFLKPRNTSESEKDRKVIDYFAQLDKKTLKTLYDMYKIDFEMFGYSLQPYVKTIN